jgi:hypothetical protein
MAKYIMRIEAVDVYTRFAWRRPGGFWETAATSVTRHLTRS